MFRTFSLMSALALLPLASSAPVAWKSLKMAD
jgi:hypothetical protein